MRIRKFFNKTVDRTVNQLPDPFEKQIYGSITETKGFLNEFKKFALKGNVVDLAIGIIIGAAFKDIVDSLVNDIIMPIIGLITGNVDFSEYYINLTDENYTSLAEAEEAGAAVIKYGSFFNFILIFLIVSFSIFLLIRYVNKVIKEEEEKPVESKPKVKKCPYCLEEVKINATRCKFCTQEIPHDKEKSDSQSRKKEKQG